MNLKCLLGHWWINDQDENMYLKVEPIGGLKYTQLFVLRNTRPAFINQRSSLFSFMDSWGELITPNNKLVSEWVANSVAMQHVIILTVKKRHCAFCGKRQIKTVEGIPIDMLLARRIANG